MNDMSMDWHAHYKAVTARLENPKRPFLHRDIYDRPIGPKLRTGDAHCYGAPIGPLLPWQERDVMNVAASALLSSMPRFAPHDIALQVCMKYRVRWLDVKSKRRSSELMPPRFEVAYRLRHETTWSYPRIAKFLGGRDHTSAMAAVRRYTEMLERGEVSL